MSQEGYFAYSVEMANITTIFEEAIRKGMFWGRVLILVFIILGNFLLTAHAASDLQWETTNVYFDRNDRLVIEGYLTNTGHNLIEHLNRVDFHVDIQTNSSSRWRLADFSVYDQEVNLYPGEQKKRTFRQNNINKIRFVHWYVSWHIDFKSAQTSLPSAEDEATPTLEEQKALELLNADRIANGLLPLKLNKRLTLVARAHAADMINRKFFDHVNPDGKSPFDRMEQASLTFSNAGENIAYDQSVEKMEVGWMNSPPHRANILFEGFTEVGIGMVRDTVTGSLYGVQDFLSP